MKDFDYVLNNYTTEREGSRLNCRLIDSRDIRRLAEFVPEDQLYRLEIVPVDDYYHTSKVLEFTEENIIKQLKRDVEFGFVKATEHRGISSALMIDVVRMWCWILENGLEDYRNTSEYGADYFRAVQKHYGWTN